MLMQNDEMIRSLAAKRRRLPGTLTIIFLLISLLSACIPFRPKAGQEPSPTVSFALDVAPPTEPADQPRVFPTTLEDSVFNALTDYRQQGFDMFKGTWLTQEFAERSQFSDFMAATVNNTATTPSALMGWEIQKTEAETGGVLPQGTMKALVRTSYQGGVTMCRWLFFSTPQMTGDHWRISEQQIANCDGAQTPVPPGAEGQAVQPAQTTPIPTNSTYTWYPCPGAPASGIQIGSKVYVNPFPPLGVKMHLTAGLNTAATDYQLQPGEVVTITAGPTCTDGIVFWQIHYIGYLTPNSTDSYVEYDAWIAEMLSNDNYLLLPCPASGPCGGGFTPVRTQSVPFR